jgi:hypothetical protein
MSYTEDMKSIVRDFVGFLISEDVYWCLKLLKNRTLIMLSESNDIQAQELQICNLCTNKIEFF